MSVFRFHKAKTKDDAADSLVIRRLKPPRRYSFGRHLAFTVGEDSIQMATASHLGTKVMLLDVRKHYVTESDGDAENRRAQTIRKEIRRYVDEFGGPQSTIAVTLAGKETALRLMTLPRLHGSDLAAAVAYEAKRQFPFSVDDCWIDHQVIERITSETSKQVRASVMAATRTAVAEQLAPFQELGLRVDYVYHTQEVVGQLLRALADFKGDRDYMLVDIHRKRTEISYYHGGDLQFFHVSSLGSSFLASRADTTVFEYFAESLATELQNSLDYFGGQFSGQTAHEVFVHGDLAYTTELIELLSDRVGFTFKRFPVEQLKLPWAQGSSFETDIPVCLPTVAAAVNQTRAMDLLPEPLKERRLLRSIDRFGIAGLVLVALMATGQWVMMNSRLNSSRDSLAELQTQITEFQSSDLFSTCTQVESRVAANKAYLKQAQEKKSYLGLNLKEISYLVPSGIHLQTMEYLTDNQNCNLSMSGIVTSVDTPPEVILAEFVANLARSPFYDDISVDRNVKRQENREFVLEFNLSMKAVI
jgi:Tfp pilus assembly PilM family ATPase